MTLRVNSLSGFGGGGFSFALVDTDTTQNNTNTPSFASMTAGGPTSGRVLIAVIACVDDDTGDGEFWPTTCTIGGVSAPRQAESDVQIGGASMGAAVYSATVPNGATVDVDLTAAFSGTMDDWACALFRATGVSETPLNIDQSAGSLTLDTGGAKFVVLSASDETDTNTAWTGGGNPTVAVIHNQLTIGYDDAPLGGAADAYNVDVDGDAYAAAAFG